MKVEMVGFGPVRKTRFSGLSYQRQGKVWRFLHGETGAVMGAQYQSREELLADLDRYAVVTGEAPEPPATHKRGGIEYLTTLRNGELVDLHRCPECTRRLANITGSPVDDNGFRPVNVPLRHLPKCPLQT